MPTVTSCNKKLTGERIFKNFAEKAVSKISPVSGCRDEVFFRRSLGDSQRRRRSTIIIHYPKREGKV
jgi:hypothetical protein